MKITLHSLVICFFSIISISTAMADRQETIVLNNGHEIEIEIYPSKGTSLLLWLPSDHGLTSGLRTLASKLAEQGTEVWIADPFTTWFLPATAESLKEINSEDYLQLVKHALATNKHVTLGTNDKGTSVLLETASLVNSGIPQDKLAGAVIISPSLYVETPASGTEAQFLPIAQTSNLNILLIIPKKSTAYLRVTELQNILSTSGNTIYVQILPEIRDRFFFREDATDIEQQAAAELDQKIISGMQLLQKTPAAIQTQVTLPLPVMASTSSLSTTGNLLPFKGNWIPEAFSLSDMNDVTHSLDQYTGKVVLINFWASWCPPCIHEIPSMTKLQDAFGSNRISILAINLGEEKGSIETFLGHHPVNFTVLLDPGQ